MKQTLKLTRSTIESFDLFFDNEIAEQAGMTDNEIKAGIDKLIITGKVNLNSQEELKCAFLTVLKDNYIKCLINSN